MPSGTEFTSTESFALLLVGPPLAGKTTVAMQFPKPYILSTDRKLANAVKRLPKGHEWWFDYGDMDAAEKLLSLDRRWPRFVTLFEAAIRDPKYETIVVDNLSDASEWLKAFLSEGHAKLTAGGEKVMELPLWQPYFILMTRMISKGRACKKNLVICVHEDSDKDEATGIVTYRPLVGGQLRHRLSSMFTDVWRCEVRNTSVGPRYFVRTQPTGRMMLGNSLDLPAEFDFTWEELHARMSGSYSEPNKPLRGK